MEPSKEEIVAFVTAFFQKIGFRCFANVNLGKYSITVDLLCKKEKESLIVEIGRNGYVEKPLRKLQYIHKIRHFAKVPLYLALPKNVELSGMHKTAITANGILVIWVGPKRADVTLERLASLEKKNYIVTDAQISNSLSNLKADNKQANPEEIKSTLTELTRLSQKDASDFSRVSFQNRAKIPFELLNRITYSNMTYSKELNNFARQYQLLESEEQESSLILENLRDLWAGKFEKSESAKAFENFKIFEPVLLNIEGYRDHFIHPFQVLLLGSLVIDQNYRLFENLVRKKMPEIKSNTVDFSWLLAATFHDFCYPIELFRKFTNDLFEKFLNSKQVKPEINLNNFLLEEGTLNYVDQLASLFDFYSTQDGCPQWVFNSECKLSDSLRNILLADLFERKDHGILSSITLVKKIMQEEFVKSNPQYIKERFSTDIYPAALAIALHNITPHKVDSEIPKIWFERMPLVFLLIYCDTVQDWGRPGKDRITVEFVNFTVSTNEILTELSVKTRKEFDEKIKEYQAVFQKLRSEQLCFSLNLICDETGTEHKERTKPAG